MIFIDTTVWVGDADLNDDFHESSHRIMESVRTGKTPLGLVSDYIIDELVTLLGKRKGFGAGHAKKQAWLSCTLLASSQFSSMTAF